MSDLKTTAPMYVQRMDKLPFNSIDALETRVKTLKPKRYGIIVHDKDVDDDGNLKDPHVHVMMQFDTAQRISSLAKKFNDLEQNFESQTKFNRRNGVSNGFSYLTHRTANAADRYQYDFSEVIANFDYEDFMNKLEKQVQNSSGPEQILQKFSDGEITLLQAKHDLMNLGPQVYASKARSLREISAAIQDISAEQWRVKMRQEGKRIRVIWLYGGAGTGKTRFAEAIARKSHDDNSYFISGSSNDVFQFYQGESTVILDELRSDVLQYADLLKILDPFNFDTQTVSRYHNLQLKADEFIISSPYNPAEFFSRQKSVSITDGFAQLQRRIAITVEVTSDSLNEVEFTDKGYVTIASEPNPYFVQNTSANKVGLAQLITELEDTKDDE